MSQDPREYLKNLIAEKVFIPQGKERFVTSTGNTKLEWIFDFRKILLQPKALRAITDLFLEKFPQEKSYQICGLEVAAIPLVAGIVMNLSDRGKDINGFFIRKSRKKEGLLRMIEGEITADPIILVDDIINTGKSFIRQVEVIEGLGKKVDAVITVLRFRDEEYYQYFHEKGIQVISIFTLDDFSDVLSVKNIIDKKQFPIPMPFSVEWYFKSENPNHFHVVPKSAPAIDKKRIYFGSDSGVFWALNQEDGSTAWSYKVGFDPQGKYILSSPVIHDGLVYFGAYDGNFYALDTHTGKKKWIFMEADWIGSSPCIAINLGLIFVGLEFGLWNKHGGITALDIVTGQKRWEYSMPGLTHSSPAYSEKLKIVVCGCNNFSAYALDLNGKLLWEFKTGAEIRASFAFDEKRELVAFGSHDKNIYVLRAKTGEVVYKIETNEAIYSNPCIHEGRLYMASMDKNLYCIDLNTGAILWKFSTNARIFSTPEIVGDKIYIGSNDGRLYELDIMTGKNTAFFQSTERITNKIAYNKETNKIFLLTSANELYCLNKSKQSVLSHRMEEHRI